MRKVSEYLPLAANTTCLRSGDQSPPTTVCGPRWSTGADAITAWLEPSASITARSPPLAMNKIPLWRPFAAGDCVDPRAELRGAAGDADDAANVVGADAPLE